LEAYLQFSLSRHFEYANEQITYHFWLCYPSRAPEFTPGFGGDVAVQSLVFCVVLCTSLFVFCSFSLAKEKQNNT
jgi:hypothetical protein